MKTTPKVKMIPKMSKTPKMKRTPKVKKMRSHIEGVILLSHIPEFFVERKSFSSFGFPKVKKDLIPFPPELHSNFFPTS